MSGDEAVVMSWLNKVPERALVVRAERGGLFVRARLCELGHVEHEAVSVDLEGAFSCLVVLIEREKK